MFAIFLLAGIIGSAGKKSSQARPRPGIPWNAPQAPPRRALRRDLLGEQWPERVPGAASPTWEKTAAEESKNVAMAPPVRLQEPEVPAVQSLEQKVSEPGNAAPPDRNVTGWTAEDLAQGVIWAEVLGRPRALRPFQGPRM